MRVLTNETNNVLCKAQLTQERSKVKNSHPALANDLDWLTTIATALGIDFEKTGNTFTLAKKRNGENIVYSPCVMTYEGEAAIIWGDVNHPLSKVPVEYALITSDKGYSLSFDLLEVAGVEDYIELTLVVKTKDEAGEPIEVKDGDIRKAIKKGNLGEYLVTAFTKTIKLSDIEPGSYSVVGYTPDPKYDKFTIIIEGIGPVKANSAITRKLHQQPVISPETPARLEIREVVETTDSGYPIVPVVFEPASEAALPVYEF